MKQETFVLFNADIRYNLINHITDLPLDGKIQVIVRQTGTKSARQRGYQWIVYKAIVDAGIGGEHEADTETLDLASKFRWALPILIRDDDFFAEAYLLYSQKYRADPERMKWWIAQNVHTEKLSVNQMVEYLNSVIHYYVSHGVAIPEPADDILQSSAGDGE